MFVAAAIGTAVTWVGATAASAGALMISSLSVAGFSTFTAAAITNTLGTLALNAALAVGVSLIMQPKTGAGGSPTAFKADPAAPISGVMGRFGVGGRQQHANVWGKGNLYLSFATALSLGPIEGIAEFKANDTVVTFPGPQGLAAAVEPYKDKMWMTYKTGLLSDGSLMPPTGVPDPSPAMSEWTTNHKSSGVAASFWTLRNNSKKASYEGGVPRPMWTLLGMKVWQPRFDSTYPGGSGAQRRDDWRTWGYSENPYDHALAWVRGHFKLNADGTIDRTKKLAGIGAPDVAVDIAAFVDGANVASANSWTVSGEWTTSDDKWQVLSAMLQAGGGVPLSRGAQISCMINTPRASIMTLTQADLVGTVNIRVMASRKDRPNTIIPRYRSEPHKFEEVPAGAVTSSVYVTEDRGEERSREVSYRYVRAAKQAAELAAYDLANVRETLRPTIPGKIHLLNLRSGDAFTVDMPETGMNGQKVVLIRRSFDVATGAVTLECRSETDAKHAWALGQTASPAPSPTLTAPSVAPPAPLAGDWTVTVRPPEADGSQQPGLIVTQNPGVTVTDNVRSILIEVSNELVGPWEQVYDGPSISSAVPVNNLRSGEDYYVAITYYSLRGVPSAQTVFGPYVAPDFVAGDTIPVTPGTVSGTPSLSITTAIAADGTQVSRMYGSWTAPADALSYLVEFDNGTITWIEPAAENAIDDRIVVTGPSYRYRVKAVSRTGTLSAAWSSWSALTAAPGDTTAPGVVTAVSCTAGPRNVALGWANPGDDDLAFVRIYRHTANVSGSASLLREVNGTSLIDTSGTVGVQYWYWAATVDRSGNEGTRTALGNATFRFISTGGGDVSATDPTLVTSQGTAAGITGQTLWATYGTYTPAQVQAPLQTYLFSRTQSQIAVGAGGQRWFRVARVISSAGRGSARITLGFDGGGAVPSAIVLDVSSDWNTNGGSIAIVSNGVGGPIVQARLSKNGSGEAYLDVQASLSSTNMMIDVEPLPGTAGVWAVHYVDGPTVGANLVGAIPTVGVTGVMTNGTYTLISAAGGVNTNGVAAVNSSGVSFDVSHGADRAVLERGANITETRVASSVTGQTGWATYGTLTPATVQARVNNLDGSGNLTSLSNINTRSLSLLTGRTADQLTYVSGGATVESLRPGEAGANVTESRTAAAIAGQSVLATNSDFAGVTGATRPSDNAGTSGTLTALGSHSTVRGNFVQKSNVTGTHGAWQGGAAGPPQRGSCFISGSVISAGMGHGWLTCYALGEDATSFVDTSQRYRMIVSDSAVGAGSIYLQHPGGQTSTVSVPSLSPASRAMLAYDGSTVKAIVDGIVYHSVDAPPGLRLWPKMLDYYQSQSSVFPSGVVDIQHGTWTENTVSTVTLIPYNTETTVSGSTATKTGGSNGSWGAGVTSREKYAGAAYCSFRFGTSAQPYAMAGLANAAFGGNYVTLNYALFVESASSNVAVYENGSFVATVVGGGSWALTDVWSVVYDGVRVQYLQNGVVRHTSQAAAGQILGFGASQVYIGNNITDIQVGPANQVARVGQNTYDDSGGALVSRGGLITSLGTAASISGQGPGATAAANRVLNDRFENGVRTIAQPDGATFNGGSSNMAGQIQIVMPFGATNTMMRFKVSIYDYDAGRTYEYIIGGYNYTLTSWINVSATFNGPRSAAKPVKFGYYAGLVYIWIGNVGDLWQYPVVSVTEFQAGYNNQSLAWESGWNISLNNTDISAITYNTVSVPRNGDQVFGEGLLEQAGGAVATRANFRTDQGVAASYAGQTPLATQTFPTHAGVAAAKAAGLTDGRQFYDSTNSNLLTAVTSAAGGFGATANATGRSGSRSGAGSVTTNTVTITPTGASGAVTYSWYRIGGDTAVNVTSASAASTTFNGSVGVGETKNATFACAVTDAGSGKTVTLLCTATLVEVS
jgi:hypothetical protein